MIARLTKNRKNCLQIWKHKFHLIIASLELSEFCLALHPNNSVRCLTPYNNQNENPVMKRKFPRKNCRVPKKAKRDHSGLSNVFLSKNAFKNQKETLSEN